MHCAGSYCARCNALNYSVSYYLVPRKKHAAVRLFCVLPWLWLAAFGSALWLALISKIFNFELGRIICRGFFGLVSVGLWKIKRTHSLCQTWLKSDPPSGGSEILQIWKEYGKQGSWPFSPDFVAFAGTLGKWDKNCVQTCNEPSNSQSWNNWK